MLLKQIELINFRNHKNLKLDFLSTTILIGQNGVGKTNILEAINMVGTGFSWRTRKEEDFVCWDKSFYKIIAELDQNKIELIGLSKKGGSQTIKINDLAKKKIDLLGLMPTVLFTPENLNIVTGPPITRRRFLNFLLIQIDKSYTKALILYNKIIHSRNALLESISCNHSRTKELDFWNAKMVQIGKIIISKRTMTIEYFNNLAKNYLKKMGKNKLVKIEIKYLPSVSTKDDFLKILEDNQRKELLCKMTLYGPHRDDLEIVVDGKSAKNFSSRGEIRSIVLALKRVELDFLRTYTKKDPLLLLDDIFSELDKSTKENLKNLLDTKQMIFTSTDSEIIPKNIMDNAQVIKL